MKKWNVPEVVELDVLKTMGGTAGGSEKNGKGEKWNGGMTEPTPTPDPFPGTGSTGDN